MVPSSLSALSPFHAELVLNSVLRTTYRYGARYMDTCIALLSCSEDLDPIYFNTVSHEQPNRITTMYC